MTQAFDSSFRLVGDTANGGLYVETLPGGLAVLASPSGKFSRSRHRFIAPLTRMPCLPEVTPDVRT